MDRTKCRNASRTAGEPLPVRGSCLTLWKRSAIRDELHRVLTAPTFPRSYGMKMPPPRAVIVSHAAGDELQRMRAEMGAAQAASAAAAAARPLRADPVRDAWIEMLLPHFSDADCCFFTGTYSDEYGYPHGLMLPRNALADFRRFLADEGYQDNAWVVCAEPHQCRPIWHHHALLAGVDAAAGAHLKAAWVSSRGWADAPPLHDGGVCYATKYATKSGNEVLFEWNLP